MIKLIEQLKNLGKVIEVLKIALVPAMLYLAIANWQLLREIVAKLQ